MSELEKARAASLLSIMAIALVVLSVMNGDAVLGTPSRESIEVCAASKGALCEDAVAPVRRFAHHAGASARRARF